VERETLTQSIFLNFFLRFAAIVLCRAIIRETCAVIVGSRQNTCM